MKTTKPLLCLLKTSVIFQSNIFLLRFINRLTAVEKSNKDIDSSLQKRFDLVTQLIGEKQDLKVNSIKNSEMQVEEIKSMVQKYQTKISEDIGTLAITQLHLNTRSRR